MISKVTNDNGLDAFTFYDGGTGDGIVAEISLLD